MCTDRGIRRKHRRRARQTVTRLIFATSALLLVLTSGWLSPPPANAARVDPTDNPYFSRLWARSEMPIIYGRVSRSWVWGESSLSPSMVESNADGERIVQYFDKGGMQFNPDPVVNVGDPGYVMASPLAYEMVTGQLADGRKWEPAQTGIAGDADDVTGPTYATFANLRGVAAVPDGAGLIQAVDREGTIYQDESLAQYGASAAYHVSLPNLDHQIASPFWSYIQGTGPVYEATQVRDEPLFEDHWSMFGLPLTEAYWSKVKIQGSVTDVLVQVFERRVLTYAPNQPAGWQVQIANTGKHYVDWRYSAGIPTESTPNPAMLPTPVGPDYGALQAELLGMLSSAAGNNALTVFDLQTGERISINGSRRQLAACTIKIPIMIAVARDISAGKYTAADVQHLVLPAMGPSLTWPARELLRITGDGDVGAGVGRANEIMASYGVKDSLMTHAPGYWGEEHGYLETRGEVENWLTTDDLATLLSGIWRGNGLTPAEREYVLWSLTLATPFLDAAFRTPLPAEAASFHKIGVLYQPENTWNDAGIVVFERNGLEYAYVVAFLSAQNNATYKNGYYLNQSLNAAIWQSFSADR